MKTADVQKFIKDISNTLTSKWNFYRHEAYLKKMGWTEEVYQKQTDTDYNYRATRIKDCYHGYDYMVVFEYSQGDPWSRYPTWIDGYDAIQTWCKENCKDKWRTDIYRVIKNYWGEWEQNDLGGRDALFFAFKSQEDAFMFKLTWGGE